MKKSEILKIVNEELDIVLEVKLSKGDVIYDKSFKEYGVVNKVSGKVAYVKFTSTGEKSFDPVMLSSVKYKGKHKGKDLYITEATVCSSQKNRITEVKFKSQADVDKAKKITWPNGTYMTLYAPGRWVKHDKKTGKKSTKVSSTEVAQFIDYGKRMKNVVPIYEGKLTEALARGLKPLLTIGTKISSKVGEKVLLKLSDKFEDIDDENADDIASHLNMAIELMQDGSPSEARGWLKKFNKVCKDALKGKSTKSAFEGVNEGKVNESMIGVITTGNYKPADLQKALDKAKIKGYSMNRLTQTMTALKVDKKYFQAAQKVIKDSGLAVAMAKESVTEATDVWKRFDAMQKLQGQAMDIEMDMKSITKDLKLAHIEMEEEAEPEGGPVSDRYADQIDKLEKEYKKKKVELKKVFTKLDKLEQF